MMHVFIHPKELSILYARVNIYLSSEKHLTDYFQGHHPSVLYAISILKQHGYLDEKNIVLKQFYLNNSPLMVGDIFFPIDKYEFISKYNRGEILE